MNDKKELLRIEELKMYFPIRRGVLQRTVGNIRAVDGISFSIYKGETLGLVGESGCGKSTLGRTILQLYKPTSGKIYFNNENITYMTGEPLRMLRKNMQMIFQDPLACLHPRMTAEEIIAEPLIAHRFSVQEIREKIPELFDLVGLSQAFLKRYPHEFSGGQRQRIGIARALALQPELIICDEPISALDVSIQAQIVNLLEDLQDQIGLTYLFIAHDLSMIRHISTRIAVMYLGNIVEIAESDELNKFPLHPYTQALLSAVPVPDPEFEQTRERIVLKGEISSSSLSSVGCKFYARCPRATSKCQEKAPVLKEHNHEHVVACYHA